MLFYINWNQSWITFKPLCDVTKLSHYHFIYSVIMVPLPFDS